MSLVNLAHVCSHLQNASKGRLALTSVRLTKLHLAIALALQREGFVSTVTIGGPRPPEMDELINPRRDPAELPKVLRAKVPQRPERAKRPAALQSHTDPSSQPGESVVEAVKEANSGSLGNASTTATDPSTPSEADLESLLGTKIYALYKNHLKRTSRMSRRKTSDTKPGEQDEPTKLEDLELHQRPLTKEALRALNIPVNPAKRRLWFGLKYWNNSPVISQVSLVSKPKKRITLDYRALAKITKGFRQGEVRGLTKPGECLIIGTDQGVMEAREAVERRIGGLVYCRVV